RCTDEVAPLRTGIGNDLPFRIEGTVQVSCHCVLSGTFSSWDSLSFSHSSLAFPFTLSPGFIRIGSEARTSRRGMTMNTKAILTAGLYVTSGTILFAQQPITKTLNSSTSTATIQAIDSTARTVVLRNEKGEEDTYSAGPQIIRFDELK